QVAEMAAEILPLTREAGVPFIVNDHPEVAASVGADGVHVGQDDLPMREVRAIVGDAMLVGRSTHSLEQARVAAAEPADYIGFGPLFATPTKPDYVPIGTSEIAAVHREHPNLPIFCIGGIKRENVRDLLTCGARRVVIVSGILHAADVTGYVRDVKAMLREADGGWRGMRGRRFG
ncbi:MAG: thiamine phosphate synthase, partial [Verrucomicrobiae bacterium]|nr:thiamine phosphate synthase [Verrucomicrobiae bacterium]